MTQKKKNKFILMREQYILRSKFYQKIRNYFQERDFLEVETPILSPNLIPEVSIEVFKADFVHPYEPSLSFYLIPSPEIFMKELLSEGLGSLFQITKSFRNAESLSPYHNPEFSMLEWYGVDMTYRDNIVFTHDLLKTFLPLAVSEVRKYLEKPPLILTMKEAFMRFARVDLDQCITFDGLKEESIRQGYTGFVSRSETWEELFNFIFVSYVEPCLPSFDQPVYLIDYPAQIVTTAKQKEGEPYYERWELYMKGIEIANCFTEETREEKVQEMFESEAILKEKALVPHGINFNYALTFREGKFPASSGVAMGLDRMLMVLSSSYLIDEVISFPFSTLKKMATRVKK